MTFETSLFAIYIHLCLLYNIYYQIIISITLLELSEINSICRIFTDLNKEYYASIHQQSAHPVLLYYLAYIK